MPLGLAQQGLMVYLVFRFKGEQKEQVVAIHDIVKVSISSFAFVYPRDFDLADFDIVSAIEYSKDQALTLEIGIPPASEVKVDFHLPNSVASEDSATIQQFKE